MEPKNIKDEVMEKIEMLKEKIKNFLFKSKEKNPQEMDENVSLSNEKKKLILKAIEESQKNYENEVKEENEKFLKEKEMILKQKNEQIKKIEIEKKSKIEENNKRYKNLLLYLNSIKNDKNKLEEFLQNKNNFNLVNK